MTDHALRFAQVTRRFGRTLALDALDLAVPRGEIVGLVGRNGAGKTTSLRLALGTLWADAGEIRVLGLDPRKQFLEVKRVVSLFSEESALYEWMTAGEILAFAGKIHPQWDRELERHFVDRLDIDVAKKIGSFSRGMKAKLALVLAVACRPELLLLDDPTAGLDPLVRREVLEGILAAIPEAGGSVIYASHLVHDVERIADRVVVLDDGRKTLEGRVDALKERTRRAKAVFAEEAPAGIAIDGALSIVAEGRALELVAEAEEDELQRALVAAGAHTIEFSPLSLEEILVACLRGLPEEISR